jgi:hypothetical protein
VAVNFLGYVEVDGVYKCRVREFRPGAPTIALPVGEIRTQEGRVFRLD